MIFSVIRSLYLNYTNEPLAMKIRYKRHYKEKTMQNSNYYASLHSKRRAVPPSSTSNFYKGLLVTKVIETYSSVSSPMVFVRTIGEINLL